MNKRFNKFFVLTLIASSLVVTRASADMLSDMSLWFRRAFGMPVQEKKQIIPGISKSESLISLPIALDEHILHKSDTLEKAVTVENKSNEGISSHSSLVLDLRAMQLRVGMMEKQNSISSAATNAFLQVLSSLDQDIAAGQDDIVTATITNIGACLDSFNRGEITSEAVIEYSRQIYEWYFKTEYNVADRYKGYSTVEQIVIPNPSPVSVDESLIVQEDEQDEDEFSKDNSSGWDVWEDEGVAPQKGDLLGDIKKGVALRKVDTSLNTSKAPQTPAQPQTVLDQMKSGLPALKKVSDDQKRYADQPQAYVPQSVDKESSPLLKAMAEKIAALKMIQESKENDSGNKEDSEDPWE